MILKLISLFSTVCFCEMLLIFQELPKMIKFKGGCCIFGVYAKPPISQGLFLASHNLDSSYPMYVD